MPQVYAFLLTRVPASLLLRSGSLASPGGAGTPRVSDRGVLSPSPWRLLVPAQYGCPVQSGPWEPAVDSGSCAFWACVTAWPEHLSEAMISGSWQHLECETELHFFLFCALSSEA